MEKESTESDHEQHLSLGNLYTLYCPECNEPLERGTFQVYHGIVLRCSECGIDIYTLKETHAMPLQTKGKNAVGNNIKELTNNGTKKRSRKQIIAIAESAARKGKSKKDKK